MTDNVFDLHVDEGHGGVDGGASGGGLHEDTRNLLLGDAVVKDAQRQGWHVTRSRDEDEAVALAARYDKANKAGADAFVSLHHDWSKGEQAVIFPNSNDAREVRSQRLADAIYARITSKTDGIPDGGTYADRRGLAVLRGTHMPAVIVEASRVQDAYSAAVMASAIVRGICDFHEVAYVVSGQAKPAPKPKPKHVDRLVLQNGDGHGNPAKEVAVRHLQHLLNLVTEDGAGKLVEDGDFGDITEKHVRTFQKAKKVKGGADGIVGENTWAALHKVVK